MGDGEKYQPRLAKLTKWPHFNGYGFNLHAERGKAGQYIGKVDPGSPAEAAGLKQGDRIVEVDMMNIGNENHQQVVGRIKAGGDTTSLLVVDNETDKYFKEHRMVVRSDMPEVLVLSSELPRPGGADTNEETGENGELNGVTSADIEQINGKTNEIDLDSDAEEITAQKITEVEAAAVETTTYDPPEPEHESAIAEFTIPPPPTDEPEVEREATPEPVREPSPELVREPSPEPIREPMPEPVREPTPEPVREPTPEPVREPTPEPVREPTPEPVRAPTPEPVRAPTPEPVRAPTPEPVRAPTPEPVKPPTPEPVRTAPEPTPAPQTNGAQANGDPIMRMSAKEMREQLAAKKKADARNKKIGFKDKYDIFQRL